MNPLKIIFLLFCFFGSLRAQETFFKSFEVDQWTTPSQIVQLADGGYIITGFSSHSEALGTQNFFFMKTDESGNFLWTKTAGIPLVPYQFDFRSSIGVTATHDSGFAMAIPIQPFYNSSF